MARLQPAQRSKLDTIPTTLGSGEREVLALAEELRADLVLVDDQAARLEARRRHLRVTGTLGILRSAAELGMIDVPSVLKNLRATNFYSTKRYSKEYSSHGCPNKRTEIHLSPDVSRLVAPTTISYLPPGAFHRTLKVPG